MHVFELTLILLVLAVFMVGIARRIGVPYPSLLALGGIGLALLPSAEPITLDPELTLVLFLAPVLLDAAFDTSMRDLKRNWIPVTCLVLVAVGLTTFGVAWIARWMRSRSSLGGSDRAWSDRRAARCRGGDGRAPATAIAAPAARDPRGREPAERRQLAAHLSAGSGNGCSGRTAGG